MTDLPQVRDILVASDLSPRCDRAVLRAMALARAWGATVHIVVAIEEDGSPSWEDHHAVEAARVEVAELVGPTEVEWRVHIRRGTPEDAVLTAITETGSRLVVVGPARSELLGRSRPGRLIETLIRHAGVPVLIARKPAGHGYRRLLAPTDFSPVSERAIETAGRLFPASALTVLHAFRPAFSGFIRGGEDEAREEAGKEAMAFVHRLGQRLDFQTPPEVLIEHGSTDDLVARYTRSEGTDLTVIGAHLPGDPSRYQGDLAGRLIILATSDVLVVPAPGMERTLRPAEEQAGEGTRGS